MKQDIGEWCFEGILHNHKIIRKIRESAKSATYLAKDSKGEKLALTYLDNEKIFERLRFRAHLEGRTPAEAEVYARKMADEYVEEMKRMVERIKGLGSEHVAVTRCVGAEPEKNQLVIVSEYTPGVDFFYATRGLKPLQMVSLFVQALEGINFIHKSGFLHLNIKPERLRVDLEGIPPIVRFMDFGFAIPIEGWQGELNGTALFMAPEAILEQRDKIDERADLYSMGVMMYLCLTERDPFEERHSAGGDRKKLAVILGRETQVSPPSHFDRTIPKELDEIVLNLLQKDVDTRLYHEAGDVLQAFYDRWPNESREMPQEDTSTLMDW